MPVKNETRTAPNHRSEALITKNLTTIAAKSELVTTKKQINGSLVQANSTAIKFTDKHNASSRNSSSAGPVAAAMIVANVTNSS